MRLNPYLMFDGQCEAAFKFYQECLPAKIVMLMRYSDSPLSKQMSPEWSQKIMHTTLAFGEHLLQGADALPQNYCRPQGFSVMLNVDSVTEADRIFNALSEHGKVQTPLQESFWALRSGMLIDPFSIPWMINCRKLVSSL
jgi:PhnB protein